MKLKYILTKEQFIFEALSNKIRQQLHDKFKKENPELTETNIDYYLDRFEQAKSSPKITNKDITKYTFAELEKTIDSLPTKVPIIKGETKYNPNDIVYQDDTLTIVNGDTKEKCIQYGRGYSWCISRNDANNMFNRYRYRYDEVNFYFVFDTTRTDDNRALVVLVDKEHNFYLANASNSDDFAGHTEYSFNDIVKIQPKLQGKESLFKAKPLTQEEREKHTLISTKVSRTNLLEYFGNYELLDAYIAYGHILYEEQFILLDDSLKTKYINLGHILPQKLLKGLSPKLMGRYTDVHSIGKWLGEHHKDSELSDMTELRITKSKIYSLKGIERVPNLKTLVLDGNSISSLRGIEKLTKLQSLVIEENKITSLKELSGLVDIYYLKCGSNQIESLNGLENLTKLEYLEIDNNYISDISILGGLLNLKKLHMSNCRITSLEPIGNLNKLTLLSCGENKLKNLNGIENLKLNTLYCGGNKFTNSGIGAIFSMPDISTLTVDDNLLTNLDGFEIFTNLHHLDCSDNQITSLKPIMNLIDLGSLRYKNNPLPEDFPKYSDIRNIQDYYENR